MFRNFFSRLMYGRYGSDQLNNVLLVLFWVFWLLDIFISISIVSTILSLLCYACLFISLFRMMSRNCTRRHRECEAFLRLTAPVTSWWKRKRCQARDKDHMYFRCPSCTQTLRVPRGKGKISITCRSCGTVFQEKT